MRWFAPPHVHRERDAPPSLAVFGRGDGGGTGGVRVVLNKPVSRSRHLGDS